MSVIEVKCLQCGKSVKVKGEFAGKKGKCPVCGKIITIPDPSKANENLLDVNDDVSQSARTAAAHEIAMGPSGYMRKKKRGFFARLFRRK